MPDLSNQGKFNEILLTELIALLQYELRSLNSLKLSNNWGGSLLGSRTTELSYLLLHTGKDFLPLVTGSTKEFLCQGIQTCYAASLTNNKQSMARVSILPECAAMQYCEYVTNLWGELTLCITAGTTLLINELDKVTQVPAAIIIFTSFVSLWEKLQRRESGNSIPESGITSYRQSCTVQYLLNTKEQANKHVKCCVKSKPTNVFNVVLHMNTLLVFTGKWHHSPCTR